MLRPTHKRNKDKFSKSKDPFTDFARQEAYEYLCYTLILSVWYLMHLCSISTLPLQTGSRVYNHRRRWHGIHVEH